MTDRARIALLTWITIGTLTWVIAFLLIRAIVGG
jgi:hypothetical protein